jgi:putative peptidoglycan lipid II flippase
MSKPKSESLGRSSGKISLATAGSRVTGLLRETVFAYLLGGSQAADAYFAATRIPNLLRDLFAEGALGSAFVPVLTETLSLGQTDKARQLVRGMAGFLSLCVIPLVILGVLGAPLFVKGLTPGFSAVPGKTELTVSLVRWAFPYLWLISLAALVAGTLNALRQFGIPAAAPILFNVGHIFTAVVFWHVFDPPVTALAAGMMVGALAQLVFQWPALKKAGFDLFGLSSWRDPMVGRVLRLMLPVILGLATLQLNNLATTIVASYLKEGSLAYLNYAFRLMHFPLGVFAVAVGTAVLPRASDAVARGHHGDLESTYTDGLRLAFFLVFPAALFLAVFPTELVRVVYERGAFLAADTEATSQALRFYALGLLGYSGVRVTTPLFYAHKDTRTPVRYAVTAVILNIVLNIGLAVPMGAAGLAFANAISGTANFVLLRRRLSRQYDLALTAPARKDLAAFAVAGGLAAAAGLAVSWVLAHGVSHPPGRVLTLMCVGGVFLLAYLAPVFMQGTAARKVARQLVRRTSD